MPYADGRRFGPGLRVAEGALYVSLILGIVVLVPMLLVIGFQGDRDSCAGNLEAIRKRELTRIGKDNLSSAFAPSRTSQISEAEYALRALWQTARGRTTGRQSLGSCDMRMFLCPASAAPKSESTSPTAESAAFPVPMKNCFYSVRNMGPPVSIDDADPGFVLLGDRSPADDGHPLAGNSANHRYGNANIGQNILDASGRIRWVTSPRVGVDEDHIYAVGSDPTQPIEADSLPRSKTDTVLMPVSLAAPG
jgi:hypothetical protein